MGVKIIPVELKDGKGYDITISNPEATVQDYLNALNRAIEGYDFERLWTPREKCFGCDLCCRERIPLTLADAVILAEHLPTNKKAGWEDALAEVIRKYCRIFVYGDIVDIHLRLTDDEACPFLNEEKGICRIYPHRPLVCQTFICCPMTGKAERLREALVNWGEDELVRWWMKYAYEKAIAVWFDEGDNPEIDLGCFDFVSEPFKFISGYSKVKIRDVVSPDLWKLLTTG
ncbi:MAG: YkgJ family cysteine cluster protein [Clostridia bacterium]|nr:YkgJ family cysteine cluster protein [Clostridia bacterium]